MSLDAEFGRFLEKNDIADLSLRRKCGSDAKALVRKIAGIYSPNFRNSGEALPADIKCRWFSLSGKHKWSDILLTSVSGAADETFCLLIRDISSTRLNYLLYEGAAADIAFAADGFLMKRKPVPKFLVCTWKCSWALVCEKRPVAAFFSIGDGTEIILPDDRNGGDIT